MLTLKNTGKTTMLSFVCALQWEANPIIKRLNLKRDLSCSAYPVYTNSSTKLIVSGVGVIAAAAATTLLLSGKEQKPELICNLGSVGGAGSWKVGDAALIRKGLHRATGRSYFPDLVVRSELPLATLESFDLAVADPAQLAEPESLVDMEGAGFYFAAERFVGPEQIQIIKVVSDLLEPKPFIQSEIERFVDFRLDETLKYLLELEQYLADSPREVLSRPELNELLKLRNQYRLTESQFHELKEAAICHKVNAGSPLELLQKVDLSKPQNKQQTRGILADLKSRLALP